MIETGFIFIYRLADKPRRQLADFMPDYFFKTDSGTWRFPVSEDEERPKPKDVPKEHFVE